MSYYDSMQLNEKKVVVGIGRGIDGLVAAYLLKKQGFEIHLVSIELDKGEVSVSFKDSFGQKETKQFNFTNNCTGVSYEKLKSIANFLGASCTLLDKTEEYRDYVLRPCMTASLCLRTKSSCILCHKVMFNALEEVADKIGAGFISTGHYAKVQENKSNGVISILTGNDLSNDQSGYLSGVPERIHHRLILPLGDLQQKEVLRISTKNGFDIFNDATKNAGSCIVDDEVFKDYVDKFFPDSLKKEGSIVRYDDGMTLCQHDGLHQFTIGEGVPSQYNSVPSSEIVVTQAGSKGKVFISEKANHEMEKFLLKLHYLRPMKDYAFSHQSFIKALGDDSFSEAAISLKVGGHLKVELKEKVQGFFTPGKSFGVYEKISSGKYTLIAHGEVCFHHDLFKVKDEKSETSPTDKQELIQF